MTQDDLEVLWRTIYGEARGEPFEGKVAVGRIILNRFKSGKWFAGKTIAETCQKPWQFSCWNENDPNRAKLLQVKPDKPSAMNCQRAALMAEREEEFPMPAWLEDCTHYHTKAVLPNWSKGKTPAGTIGNHLFYKDIK